jgi:hypothetical protein
MGFASAVPFPRKTRASGFFNFPAIFSRQPGSYFLGWRFAVSLLSIGQSRQMPPPLFQRATVARMADGFFHHLGIDVTL